MILTFMGTILLIFVVIVEGGKYGTQKSKSISLVQHDRYSYNIQDVAPLRYVIWMWMAELIPKVRNFQSNNWNNDKLFQHGLRRLVPNDYKNFDWYDNVYLEWFICNHTRVYYIE